MKQLNHRDLTSSNMGHGKYIAPPEGQFKVLAGEKLTLEYVVLPGESRDIDVAVDLIGPGAELSLKAPRTPG